MDLVALGRHATKPSPKKQDSAVGNKNEVSGDQEEDDASSRDRALQANVERIRHAARNHRRKEAVMSVDDIRTRRERKKALEELRRRNDPSVANLVVVDPLDRDAPPLALEPGVAYTATTGSQKSLLKTKGKYKKLKLPVRWADLDEEEAKKPFVSVREIPARPNKLKHGSFASARDQEREAERRMMEAVREKKQRQAEFAEAADTRSWTTPPTITLPSGISPPSGPNTSQAVQQELAREGASFPVSYLLLSQIPPSPAEPAIATDRGLQDDTTTIIIPYNTGDPQGELRLVNPFDPSTYVAPRPPTPPPQKLHAPPPAPAHDDDDDGLLEFAPKLPLKLPPELASLQSNPAFIAMVEANPNLVASILSDPAKLQQIVATLSGNAAAPPPVSSGKSKLDAFLRKTSAPTPAPPPPSAPHSMPPMGGGNPRYPPPPGPPPPHAHYAHHHPPPPPGGFAPPPPPFGGPPLPPPPHMQNGHGFYNNGHHGGPPPIWPPPPPNNANTNTNTRRW